MIRDAEATLPGTLFSEHDVQRVLGTALSI